MSFAGFTGFPFAVDSLWLWGGFVAGATLIAGLAFFPRFAALLSLLVATAIVAAFIHIQTTAFAVGHIAWFALTGIATAWLSVRMARASGGVIERLRVSLLVPSRLRQAPRTDIRTIAESLPAARDAYDPLKYATDNDSVFVGLDEQGRPVHVAQKLWRASHIDIAGQTGSGKGVLAGVLLTQAAAQGEAVVVVDPKGDEFAPLVLEQAAARAGVPYTAIDLTTDTINWNPLSGTVSEIEERFVSCFGLTERGSDADYYRLQDRKAARAAAELAVEEAPMTLAALAAAFAKRPEARKAAMFTAALGEIALADTVADGIDLNAMIADGCVLYVRGSIRNPQADKLQRMFVLAVIQCCERRAPGTGRHVCLFLDEFRYLISRPVIEALASIRDRRAHLMLAHQTLHDLHNTTADIDAADVAAAVAENCAIKLAYRVRDPDTALWLARMSGTIRAEEETHQVAGDLLLRERMGTETGLRETERYLIDPNMILSLPPRCAVLYADGPAQFVFTSPVAVSGD